MTHVVTSKFHMSGSLLGWSKIEVKCWWCIHVFLVNGGNDSTLGYEFGFLIPFDQEYTSIQKPHFQIIQQWFDPIKTWLCIAWLVLRLNAITLMSLLHPSHGPSTPINHCLPFTFAYLKALFLLYLLYQVIKSHLVLNWVELINKAVDQLMWKMGYVRVQYNCTNAMWIKEINWSRDCKFFTPV